jgi:hypothetical protein
MSDILCKAATKTGEQCKLKAGPSGYCHLHDPGIIAEQKAEREAREQAAENKLKHLKQPRFSQRRGYKPISTIIKLGGMDEVLRTSIWNVLHSFIFNLYGESIFSFQTADKYNYATALWRDFFKKPVHLIPKRPSAKLQEIYEWFQACEWYEVYDFVEYILNYDGRSELCEAVNEVLASELAGYRYIGGVITDITNEKEIDMLEEALSDDGFPSVKTHLQRALELLSDRKNPDYRNSIKESISAVESLAQIITEDPNATLGKALDKLETSGKRIKIHSALRSAFSNLYGYTSNEDGIRHAMLEVPNLMASDAKFFLLSCTSFINYLKSKL